MTFFNDKLKTAFRTGQYICDKCGAVMEFEDEFTETLICLECGNEVDFDHYGFSDEEYDELYPTLEEVLAREGEYDEEEQDDEYEEVYDEVCGELED